MQFEKKIESTQNESKPDFLKPVLIGVVAIPVSLTLWVFYVLSSQYLIQPSKLLLDTN